VLILAGVALAGGEREVEGTPSDLEPAVAEAAGRRS
jgi:hypothetical protein